LETFSALSPAPNFTAIWTNLTYFNLILNFIKDAFLDHKIKPCWKFLN
jgi:hypothetical protein